MNNFLLSKNPPAAVWKTALRMLGIVMLSFLFIPEGWGQDQPLDVTTLPNQIITLTYKTEAARTGWYYKYKEGATDTEKPFNGTLTAGNATADTPFSSPNYFIIQNDLSETPSTPLTLDNFHYSGTNGVFRITGTNPVKITANNACTLENSGIIGLEKEQKSVIYVEDGSNLELDGGGGMTVRNTRQENLIYGLYNRGTTTLSGTIEFIAKNGSEFKGAYPISNFNRTLKTSGTNTTIKATGDDLNYDEKYQSPFMGWRFENAPAADKTITIKQEGVGPPVTFDFEGDGESTTFLILGEVSASYTVDVEGEKQMGKKQDNGTGKYEDSYTNTFAATTDGAETNTKQQSVYGYVTAHPTVSTPNELKTAITSSSTDSDSPTKITFGNDINLTYANFRLESYGKYIEIDGGGHTIKPTYGYENFIFPADGGNSSLTLTNITVDCQNTSSARTYPFINVKAPNTTITLGDGFRMKGGESSHGNEIMQVYGINMQAGTLIMKEGAVIEGNTDKKGAAIGITSGATLKLEGGKIESSNGSTGLYLLRKEGATENPKVTIENDLPAGSVFEGVYLADYIDADGKITKKEVITAGGSHTIKDADLNKFTLMTVRQVGGTILSEYELYLDTDNAIKLRKFPLLVTAPTFDDVTEEYSQPDAKPITIQNTTDSEITITSVTLANSNTDFTITEPTSDDERKVSVDSPNTHYTIQPVADLTEGTYTATIEVTADGRTYTAEVSITVKPKSTPVPDPTPDPTPDPAPVPDPTPDPAPTYYQVVLPEVEGVTTDPAAGEHSVEAWDTFPFYLTLDTAYSESQPVITTSRNETLHPRTSDGAYLVEYVRSDVEIYIDGIVKNNAVANESITDDAAGPRIWSEGSMLCVDLPESHVTSGASPLPVRVLTVDGRLWRTFAASPGLNRWQLPQGLYIVQSGDAVRKVIVR